MTEKIETKVVDNKFSKRKLILIFLFVIIFFLLFDLLLARAVWPRQIDDVHSTISCSQDLLDKSDILLVIPFFNGVSIAENKTWCNQILALNKTLGLHGVYHTYQEFLESREQEYIEQGMAEFKKCFGFYPTLFEAPQLALSKQNEKSLMKMGFQVIGWPHTLSHKVYHCQDSGEFAINVWKGFRITNKLIDYI